MSDTDPGPSPTSKIELAVTIINDPSYLQVSRIGQETPSFIICYPHCCYLAKSPVLAIILLSLLYLFASKLGKICARNSIDSLSYFFVLFYLR